MSDALPYGTFGRGGGMFRGLRFPSSPSDDASTEAPPNAEAHAAHEPTYQAEDDMDQTDHAGGNHDQAQAVYSTSVEAYDGDDAGQPSAGTTQFQDIDTVEDDWTPEGSPLEVKASAHQLHEGPRQTFTALDNLRRRTLVSHAQSDTVTYSDDDLLWAEPVPAQERDIEPIRTPPGVPPSPVDRERPRGKLRLLSLLMAVIVIVAVVTTAVLLTASSHPTGSGYLQPSDSSYLNFAQNGTVNDVLVKPGDHVRVGQVLAEQSSADLQAELAADQATLYADQARALELGGGGTDAAAKIASLIDQANTQLTTAQNTAAGSLNNAQARVTAANTRATQAQKTQQDDEAQYASASASCSMPNRPAGAQPTEAECAQIQSQLTQDATAVSAAAEALSQAQQQLKTAQTSAAQSLALANSEAALASSRQNESVVGSGAGTSTEVAAANAAVSRDIAQVATDQANVTGASIVSPVDGIVGSVGAAAGDYATPNGIRTFTQTAATSAGSGFQLFGAPAAGTSGSTNASGEQPVVIVYSATMGVSAELSEHAVTKIHTGETATVTVPALGNRSLAAVVADINPTSINRDGKVYYLVDLTLAQTAITGAMPGMSANVSFKH